MRTTKTTPTTSRGCGGRPAMTRFYHHPLSLAPLRQQQVLMALCLIFTLLLRCCRVDGFRTSCSPFRRRCMIAPVHDVWALGASVSASTSSSSSARGGMGMAGTRGGGAGGSSKKKNSKKGTAKAASAAATAAPPFDVSASLLRLEKTYDRLLLEASKRQLQLESEDDDFECDDDSTTATEYVIATRDRKVLPDWVPVAQLIVVNVNDNLVQAAVSSFCREIHHVAGLACNTFRSIPRQGLEYSVEPAESFYKFVYDAVVEKSASDAPLMTTAEARRVLGIDVNDASSTGGGAGGTHADLKRKYRARSFECHPDRVRHAADLDDAAREQSAIEYAQVQLAYETLLGSGSVRREGRTWYESLGGKERTDFRPTGLLPLRQAEQRLQDVESAVMGLDPQLVQSFVARSLASKQQS